MIHIKEVAMLFHKINDKIYVWRSSRVRYPVFTISGFDTKRNFLREENDRCWK